MKQNSTVVVGFGLWGLAGLTSGCALEPLRPVERASIERAPLLTRRLESRLVRPRETWYGIARERRISVTELLALNRRPAGAVLQAGEVVLVPAIRDPVRAVSQRTGPPVVAGGCP